MPETDVRVPRLDRSAAWAETALYVMIAVVLVAGAVVLLAESAYTLIDDLDDGAVDAARTALDSLLLTFIFVELLAAVRVTVRQQRLVAEPFFLVGIIASIKEIVLLVGAEDLTSEQWDDFRNGMIEVGVLAGVVLILTICTLLARRRLREPEEADDAKATND
jgi:uncharacterized membrane protein (DUF373 family)